MVRVRHRVTIIVKVKVKVEVKVKVKVKAEGMATIQFCYDQSRAEHLGIALQEAVGEATVSDRSGLG